MVSGHSPSTLTMEKINKELEDLKKKIFVYETLNAEKDVKNKRVKGPFKNGKEVISHIKR